MESGSVIKVLRSALKLVYDEHVGRLLAIPQPFLDTMYPDKRTILQDIFTSYNTAVEAEISRYGDCMQTAVIEILERGRATGNFPFKEAVIEVVDSFIDPNLYEVRFEKFVESIDRKSGWYGTDFGLANHRLEIPRSVAHIGAENGCKRVNRHLLTAIDALYLSQTSSNDAAQESRSFYSNLNALYSRHPALFWLLALAVSILFGVVTL